MLRLAVYSVCGATVCYLWGRRFKGRAESFNRMTRVKDLGRLDDLLKEKPTGLLLVVSGSVGSTTPFDCKDIGPSGVVWEQRVEMNFEACKLGDGGVMINKSLSFLVQEKETPWYLEDSTGQVNVVGAKDAKGFDDILKEYVLDWPQSISEATDILTKSGDGLKVPVRSVIGRTLNTGTFLTFVAEAGRDGAGNPVIQKPEKGSFMVFSGEDSFDKMVGNIKSNSEFCMLLSTIFGTVVVGVAIMYGVGFVREKVIPFIRKKRDLRKRSKDARSDSEETDQGEESD